MHIFRALLLSSKSKAESFELLPRNGIFGVLDPCYRYRLIVELGSDTFTFTIYRVTYPEKQAGKGWGEPHYSEQPHRTVQLSNKSELYNYLRRYQFDPDGAWQPLEE